MYNYYIIIIVIVKNVMIPSIKTTVDPEPPFIAIIKLPTNSWPLNPKSASGIFTLFILLGKERGRKEE